MQLTELLNYSNIAIQCHDNPDADSIACGFALYEYFKTAGKTVSLFYSGPYIISKPNLLEMVSLLQIPIQYIKQPMPIKGLLVMVDCQYDTGNVTKVEADQIAVIDHHIIEKTPPTLHDIRPYLGSCSTLIWTMLNDVKHPISQAVSTALYYGLYTDTNGFTEVRHPLDRDLRDITQLQERTLKILKNTNLSLSDLQLASLALQNLDHQPQGQFAIIHAKPCDPNMLGLISDLAMQVDSIDNVIAFCEVVGGYKFSVRTITRENKAADIAIWLTNNDLGSGGGHAEKAGGFISQQQFINKYPNQSIQEYFKEQLENYLNYYLLIDTQEPTTLNQLIELPQQTFEKLAIQIGYVPCSEITNTNSKLNIRMLEGDIVIKATPQTYLMIGINGEIYPIEQQKFYNSYTVMDEPLQQTFLYPPVVLNTETGERVSLLKLAKTCLSKSSLVKACQLKQPIKLFTQWDSDNYLTGEIGDWLINRSDDTYDFYLITQQLFNKLYQAVE